MQILKHIHTWLSCTGVENECPCWVLPTMPNQGSKPNDLSSIAYLTAVTSQGQGWRTSTTQTSVTWLFSRLGQTCEFIRFSWINVASLQQHDMCGYRESTWINRLCLSQGFAAVDLMEGRGSESLENPEECKQIIDMVWLWHDIIYCYMRDLPRTPHLSPWSNRKSRYVDNTQSPKSSLEPTQLANLVESQSASMCTAIALHVSHHAFCQHQNRRTTELMVRQSLYFELGKMSVYHESHMLQPGVCWGNSRYGGDCSLIDFSHVTLIAQNRFAYVIWQHSPCTGLHEFFSDPQHS